ncbi:MAG: protein kinase [Bacteroidota bacterium]
MIGSVISHYKILEKLGEGGMGVVYKAQDTTLDRLVALKFLPAHVSSSSEDKARFIQEAKAAASLTHQNICTIHGVEEQDGKAFIVMEYVEGKTLNDLKANMPLKQAVDIGIQLADGLAAAHEKGIVHRDIKPENIMIRKDGRVQIMDFGLAKLKGASRLTKEGSTVGTAGYMSPEQIQGQETDHRTDIFSLGVILYELFAGQSPFKGVHETAISYEIVNADPEPLTVVKPDLAPELNSIALECLAKDPPERTQSVAEVAKDLRHYRRESGRSRMSMVTPVRPLAGAQGAKPSGTPLLIPQAPIKRFLPWIAASLLVVGVSGFGAAYLLFRPGEKQLIHSFILPPEKENFAFYGNYGGPPALSPDGTRLAFLAIDSSGKRFLFVRSLNSAAAQKLSGTTGALFPFWSPDNQFIAFESQGKLKKIDAAGGTPLVICEVGNFRSGTWNEDGTIVFSPAPTEPLMAVPASGGTPVPVTMFDKSRNENSHRWPWFLKDGKHIVYLARTAVSGAQTEGDAIRVSSLDGKVNKTLTFASSNAVAVSGYLLYMRERNLVAQQFDESSLELKGEAKTIAQGVSFDPSVNRGLFTASRNGILVYQKGDFQSGSQLLFWDRLGKPVKTVSSLAEYISTELSPNGRQIASSVFDFKSHNNSIWIFDVARGTKSRFTFTASYNQSPTWSPDGNRIMYSSNQDGTYNLYQKPTSGGGSEEVLFKSTGDKAPYDVSPDGNYLLYASGTPKTQGDIWILPLNTKGTDGERKPVPFLQTEFNELGAQFSPDGRWVAYSSNESGQHEVYVKPFRGQGGHWQVSLSGGGFPHWRGDGKEIFYISPDGQMMTAQIVLSAASVDVSNVHTLFDVSLAQAGDYDVTADGKLFLLNALMESQNQTPLSLLTNWDAELKGMNH